MLLSAQNIAGTISSFFLIIINIIAIFLVLFYFFYRLINRKNKWQYLKSYRVKTVIISLIMITLTYLFCNIFFQNYQSQNHTSFSNNKPSLSHSKLDTNEAINIHNLFDNHILNPDSHFIYNEKHFKLPSLITSDSNRIIWERDDYTAINKYVEMTTFDEITYRDMGYLGEGMFYFYKGNYLQSLDSLDKIKNPNLPYLHLIKAMAYDSITNFSAACLNYEKALITIPKRLQNTVYERLVSIYIYQNNTDKLAQYLENEDLIKFLPYNTAKYTMLKKAKLIDYYTLIIKHNFKGIYWGGVFSALAICAVWFIFLISIDIFDQETFTNTLSTLILGALFSFLSYALGDIIEILTGISKDNPFAYYMIVIGFVEEFVKIIPFIILLKYTKMIDEPFDYILYASISALGFSTMENILYFDEGRQVVIFARALLSSTVHLSFTSIVAYGLVKADLFHKEKFKINLLIYLLLASTLHGIFDYLLHYDFMFGAEIVFIVCITIWFMFINNTLNFSPNFTYQSKINIDNKIVFLGTGLTGILLIEYLITLYRFNLVKANDSLYFNLFSSCWIIIFMIYKISNLDLVKQYWRPIQLSNTKTLANPYNLFALVFRFFQGNHIAAQNFVDKHIIIKPFWNNDSLIKLMNYALHGVIRDRIIVESKDENDKIIYDATWFIVKLDEDLHLQDFNTKYILIKFRNDIEEMDEEEENTAKMSLVKDFSQFKDNHILEEYTQPFGYITVSELIVNEGILGRN